MTLTTEQKAAILADIQASPTLAQIYADSVFTAIADHYNSVAIPEFTVWKTSVTQEEILNNGMDWTRIDNLSVGKARIWEWMFKFGSINPSKTNVQAGINAVWVGTAADLAVRAAVYVHCKRPATNVERLLATGTGTQVSPATMTVEGEIGWWDIQHLED